MSSEWRWLVVLLLLMALGRAAADPLREERRLDPALKLLYESQTTGTHPGERGVARKAMSLARSREILGYFQSSGPERRLRKSLLVLLRFVGDESQLAPRGFVVQSRLGSVYSGLLDPGRLSDLLDLPGVQFIQLSRRLRRFAEAATGPEAGLPFIASRTQTGAAVPLAAGTGALVGFIDTGVDIRHQDFRQPDGTTRIKFLLDLSDPGDKDDNGTLDGPDDYGGTLYTEQQINIALRSGKLLHEKDTTGHGSHALSVAAGDDPRFPGTAPGADLIVVKATRRDGTLDFESSDILNALNFIDRKAAQLGRPYVVNLSLGTSFGPHDGRTLEEIAIDSLVGPGIPGKVVVLAAGNSGDQHDQKFHHFQGTAYAGLETRHVLRVPAYPAPIPGLDNDLVLLDLWYSGNDRLSVRVTAPDGATSFQAAYGEFVDQATPFGQVFIGNLGGPSPLNGDIEAIVLLYDKAGRAPAAGDWAISIAGERIEASGVYHGWLVEGASTVGGVAPYLSEGADDMFAIGRPGNAANGITVGSFARHDATSRFRTAWTDVGGISRTDSTAHPEDISTFSSRGPTRDGRIKPEITAPGERVLGAVSRDADPAVSPNSVFRDHPFPEPDALLIDKTPDRAFGLLEGTSFAAPTVTGLVARILAAVPALDAIQVRNILVNQAHTDEFTGSVPNDLWGFGKVDLTLASNPQNPLPASLLIASEPLPDGVVGRQFNHVLTATGGTLPYDWSVIEGALPPGLNLAAGALITGIPTAAGTWRFTVTVGDSTPVRQSAQRVCELRVDTEGALAIVSNHLPVAQVNRAYTTNLEAEGGFLPYAWKLVGGSLPAGISLSPEGQLTGTPASQEMKSFTVDLADATGATVRHSFTLTTSIGEDDEWRQVGSSLVTVSDLVVDPNDTRHLYAGVVGYLASSSEGSVMESHDEGASWTSISRNNGLWMSASRLRINPLDSTLWVLDGDTVPNFYDRSSQQWRRWTNCPPPRSTYSSTILTDLRFTAAGDFYILPYNFDCPQNPSLDQFYGFLHSLDGGTTWENIGRFPTSASPIFGFGALAISRDRPSFMYAGRNSGCYQNSCDARLEEGFYRSQDGGRTWISLGVAIEANLDTRVSSTNPLDVIRFSSNPLYAFSFLDRKIIERSIDGGATWTNIALPGSPAICQVERSEANSAVLLAGTSQGVFRSTDSGLHWSPLVIEGLSLDLCPEGSVGLAFDPANADRMFVAARDYTVFASVDGGKTWKTRGQGLAIKPMNGIAISSARPTDLLAVAGFPYVSRTGGERWTLSAAGIDPTFVYFHSQYGFPLISPKDPDLYFFLDQNHTLYTSANAGLEWVKIVPTFIGGENGDPNVRYLFDSLAADPFDADTLLARLSRYQFGEATPAGIWRSRDRGATWARVGEVVPAPATSVAYHEWEPELAFDPRTPGRVHAIGPDGLYRSDTWGSSWNLAAQLPGGSPWVLDLAPSDPRYVYVVRGQSLSAYDAGAGHWNFFSASPADRFISLAVDAADPRIAYVGRWYTYPDDPPNSSGGIDKTTDAGRTWTRLLSFPTSLSVISLTAHPTVPGTLYAGTKEDGVYRTLDGGQSWEKLETYGAVADLVNVALQDPTNPFLLFAGTQGFGVQASTDGGRTFVPRDHGLQNLNVTSLAFDSGSPPILYAGTENGLFKTIDGGETWSSTAFADGLVTDVSVDEGSRPRRLRITTLNGVGTSSDEGETFTFSATGLTSSSLTSIQTETREAAKRVWVTMRGGDGVAFSDDLGRTWRSAAGNGLVDRNVNGLAIEDRSAHRLWAATDGGVFFSDDDGLSWSPLSVGLPAGVPVTSVAIDPSNGELLVSLFDKVAGGVYRGANLRGSWSVFNNGLSELRVRRLTHDVGHALAGGILGTTFYAATSGGGLFTAELETNSVSTLAMGSASLPDGAIGVRYSAALTATGGVRPYLWSLAAGSLPPGLGLDGLSGKIDGTPVLPGLYRFTLELADANSSVTRKDVSLLVHVTPTLLRVTKNGSGAGTVTSSPPGIGCGSDCAEPFAAGTRVTLKAAAASGSTFAGWGSECTGTSSCSLTISGIHNVQATFNKRGFSLTVVKAGNGIGTVTSSPLGINCGSDCSEVYSPRTRVTLNSRAGTGSVFSGWKGGGCSGTRTCVVSMTASKTVTATFSPRH